MKPVLSALLLGAVLSGCGGDEQEISIDFSTSDLVYSYPYDEQREVPTTAPVVLRFSHPLSLADQAEVDAEIASLVRLEREDAPGTTLPFDATLVDGRRGLVIAPRTGLAPATRYLVSFHGLRTTRGPVDFHGAPLEFVTRAATSGPRRRLVQSEDFGITRIIPDGSTLPFMDFSDLRIQFSQPLDVSSVVYGLPPSGSVALTAPDGSLVPALVLADGPYLTVDPLQDLTPGLNYSLSITGDVRSELGVGLAGSRSAWVPGDSKPRAILVQRAPVSAGPGSEPCSATAVLSPLTGQPINCVPVKAVLLGDESSSQQSGDVRAELAFVPNFPDTSPLRIRRSSLLTGSSVELLIAGKVPTGFSSGDISVGFISDAMGYLLPNPYSDAEESPRHVRLVMDVSMTAADDRANGGLSQGLMHVELAGVAIILDGRLTIDAVGVVEPRVMGIENAYGVLSFHLEAYENQVNPPLEVVDTTAPFLQSWMPGDSASAMRPGDPILLNFSEALDPVSLAGSGAVVLMRDGVPMAFERELDGATLIVRPRGELRFGSTYEVQVNSQVTDLTGNPLSQDHFLEFDMPVHVDDDPRSPIVMTSWPGYPCVTVERDLGNNDHGRCDGGRPSDDHLPVTELEAGDAILVQFTRDMDPDSIRLGGSFRVQRDAGGGVWEDVAGRLDKDVRTLHFYPDEPWEEGVLYRYVLGSNGDGHSSAADCSGADAICSAAGHPLQTRLLAQTPAEAPDPAGGGPDMEIYFRGAADEPDVIQVTRNLPTIDVNSNFIHEYGSGEADAQVVDGEARLPANSAKLEVTGVEGLAITDANAGCQDGDCPARKVIHLTGGLMAEVVGFDPDYNAVRVSIYPPRMVTTSVSFWAELLNLQWLETHSGPQIMRVRYEKDGNGNRTRPITGLIYQTGNGPILEASLQLYLDAPYMEPPLGARHDLRSKEFTLNLSGPIEFLDDGRMIIRQLNYTAVDLDILIAVEVGNLAGELGLGLLDPLLDPLLGPLAGLLPTTVTDNHVSVAIPVGGVNLTFLPLPVKQ